MQTVAGDGVASIKRRRRDQSSDGVRNMATASGRGRLKEDLESSTWRRQVDNEMGSKDDDDGVLDKPSLELRFKAMKVKHLNKGSGSDGPIRHIHGYGYGVLKF
ncbi:hypothetical protein Tco_1293134 [Tanacetum coccineum]